MDATAKTETAVKGKFTVYLVTNLINGKLYVGRTSRKFLSRWSSHVSHANFSNNYFQNAIKKHGREFFEIKELVKVDSLEESFKLEAYYIEKFCSNIHGLGYNLTDGGDGPGPGYKHTSEAKRKISSAALGRTISIKTRKTISLALSGKSLPESVKEKMRGKKLSSVRKEQISKALKGKRLSDEHRKAISEGLLGKTHSEQTKLSISATMKEYWKRKENERTVKSS